LFYYKKLQEKSQVLESNHQKSIWNSIACSFNFLYEIGCATAQSFPCLWQVLRFSQPWQSPGKIDSLSCHPKQCHPEFISGSLT